MMPLSWAASKGLGDLKEDRACFREAERPSLHALRECISGDELEDEVPNIVVLL